MLVIEARTTSRRCAGGRDGYLVRRDQFVTTVMSVVGLTFGFGNVLAVALRIGVPVCVALLVALALDLTVLGSLVGSRHLAMSGAREVQRPARRLLLAASTATLALNVADPICAGQ
jgi:hypothetical protein